MKILSALTAVMLMSCSGEQDPIALGFLGGLSGGNADLGEAGRNGAIMAVEEINELGGVNGRPIKLVIKDDNNRPEKAREGAQALVDLGVEAIVGPLTSTTAEAAIEVANKAKLLVVSPTASAVGLAGVDDYLIRVCPSSKDNAYAYADFMFSTLGQRRISIVADAQNRIFSDSWFFEFQTKWHALGGEIIYQELVNTKEFTEYHILVGNLLNGEPDGILFIVNSVDAARLSQQVRKIDPDVPLVAAEWAATQNLITLGGSAVDGLVTMQIVNFFDTSPRFLKFVDTYVKRFGSYPSFSSIISYDATKMVIRALKLKQDQSLKESLLSHQPYAGLQTELVIDPWGDLIGRSTFVVVKNQKYALFGKSL
jgi:branched-chain amino acid transport system substrate-binding protein